MICSAEQSDMLVSLATLSAASLRICSGFSGTKLQNPIDVK